MIIGRETAPHYTWGDRCDGWPLVQGEDLLVVEERMPPGTAETRHYHVHARQFFYVLSGALSLEVDGQTYELLSHKGVEVAARKPHQVRNNSENDVVFLVVSSPTSRCDRHDVLEDRA
ncbi:mannose-6-phosphate isomerase-like protein (cupin superfamily) [Rhizobium sp. BK529]|uniref:cupin domain-containing protein n=1 Tax=unclassified Rhizobium TaxID=2613769 RepID=UPI00104A24B1|nr:MULTISPECIES: cupin domain-containing protein [unclassified Rhizobium]MBB3595002.1 mannose-6-phosphate isomerase-like protein (cupin superfamily) [Rhizobium sp. BK529]TCR98738.1 mannose-6-phosphate isomerase-like protein (cupin superfamily) [Rhizobium sp. BK418]